MGCEARGAGRSTHPGWAATAVVPKPLTLCLLMQVWGSASPKLKRVWTSSREHEVMDEGSDQEDPEAAANERARGLLAEAEDRTKLLEAVGGMASHRATVADVERAHMQLEDFRAQLLRQREEGREAHCHL